jgi:hypothetical protein
MNLVVAVLQKELPDIVTALFSILLTTHTYLPLVLRQIHGPSDGTEPTAQMFQNLTKHLPSPGF